MQDIRKQAWSKWREKLFPIIQQTEKRNNHMFAEEINSALSNDEAFLFVGEDGFFVLQPVSNNGIPSVVVMFAFNWGENAVNRYQETIEQLSREIGARSVQLYTVVKGLIPILEAQGYTLKNETDAIMQWVKPL